MKQVTPWLALLVFPCLAACEQANTSEERFPVCEAKPTTLLALQGNLDATVQGGDGPNFTYFTTVIDGAGVPLVMKVDFAIEGFSRWTYHVRGRDLDLGSGTLDFSDEGLLANHKVVETPRVPLLSGDQGPALTFYMGSPLDKGGNGMDGITQYAASSSIFHVTLNSLDPAIADVCSEAAQLPSPQHRDPETGACPGQPTTRILMKGNLDPTMTKPHEPWDPERAYETSNFFFSELGFGPGGVEVGITFFFVKTTGNEWAYHVGLGWGPRPRILASGTLTFSESGALLHRQDGSVLRLPNGRGELGPPIALEIGVPQDLGSDGLSGLTSRAAFTGIFSLDIDGSTAIVGGICE